MTIKTLFHNINFKKNILLPKKNNKIISKINKTIFNFPALTILNNSKLLDETIQATSKFGKKKLNFLIFGTGGSNLGAKALINIAKDKMNKNIYFFDNIDPISFENFISKIVLKNTGFIFISKSGTTPETLSQLSCLIEKFDNEGKLNFFFKNCLIVTENKKSPLFNIAKENKIEIFYHEKNIGGRFSIFSNVGMVPAILVGLDVKKIHLGALSITKNYLNNDYLKIGQFFRYQNINKKISNSVIMTYSDSLYFFGKWYLQLWAESIGKENKGITPIHAVGTTDQHSQLQLYLDGPKDKFFTFITTNHAKKGLKLHSQTMKNHNINYLINKSMGDLMQAEQQATIDTFKKNKFLLREIQIDKIDEFSIGQLMALSIIETLATCLYYEVNPFDQPAVEEGKKLTKKYLN